jgi:hypothetical protein
LTCRFCHRDLTLYRPVLERFLVIDAKLEALTAEVDRIAELLRGFDQRKSSNGGELIANIVAAHRSLSWHTAVIGAIVSLLLAHTLIIVVFDLHLIFLRIASVVIPCAFAFASRVQRHRSFGTDVITGLLIAIVSASLMSTIVAYLDKVPFLPQGTHEWWETTEYIVSITLSYVAGRLIRSRIVWSPALGTDGTPRWLQRVARFGLQSGSDQFEIERSIKTIETVLAFIAAIASILAGVHQFIA